MKPFIAYLKESINPLRNPFERFGESSLVFVDIESLGFFTPTLDQVTEIAAIKVDPKNLTIIDKLHFLCKLTDQTRKLLKIHDSQKSDWYIRQALSLNNYFEKQEKAVDETVALQYYQNFISDDSILIAHNASFDIQTINSRCKKYGIGTHKNKVYDTLKISQYLFVPILQELKSRGVKEAEEMIKKLTKEATHGHYSKSKISSRLGDLSKALVGKIENWHTAFDDVRTLLAVFQHLKLFLEKYLDTDIYGPEFRKHFSQQRDKIARLQRFSRPKARKKSKQIHTTLRQFNT